MASTSDLIDALNYDSEDLDDLELDVDEDLPSEDPATYGGSSDRSSLAAIHRGYFVNGRRYQDGRAMEYFLPADEQQWSSMEIGHILMLVLDSQRANPLFRSPVSADAQHILDIGSGCGDWANQAADMFPNPPNCIFEVEDVTEPWTWNHKFDLVHMRHLLGSFDEQGFNAVYRRIYDNLAPGGWIEEVEMDVGMYSDDGTLPTNSVLHYRDMFLRCSDAAGRSLDTAEKMIPRIEAAGFINIQKQDYKFPMGTWPAQKLYKDAGVLAKEHYLTGVEGWTMFLLTHFGEPQPWTPDDVQNWLSRVKADIEAGYHIYQKCRRVWAQKPFSPESVI